MGPGHKRPRKKRLPPLVRYAPRSPGALNASDTVEWQKFLESHEEDATSRSGIARLFDEFRKLKKPIIDQENLNKEVRVVHEVEFSRRPLPEIDRSETLSKLHNIIDGLSSGTSSESARNFWRYLPRFTDAEMSQLISLARKRIENAKVSDLPVSDAKGLLSLLRQSILRRGKHSWQRIGHDDWFQWPTTDVFEKKCVKSSVNSAEWHEDGPLSTIIGYRVGNSSRLSIEGRRERLAIAFELSIEDYAPELCIEWGEPGTAGRLCKIAQSLASFTKNAKRNSHGDYGAAVRDWEDDLNFLYNEYYVGMFYFGWPKT